VISAEWCSFTDFPWGRGPLNYAPEEEQQAMEIFATWARLFELNRFYSWIVDRFHASARACQVLAGRRDPDFSWLDPRLRAVGFRHVLCVRRAETFARARSERLKVSGKPSQYEDLGVFVREQELLDRLVRESTLPFLDVDVSDDDVAGAADRVADWLERTGGLSAPWGLGAQAP